MKRPITKLISIKDIIIKERQRVDLGDIPGLAKSLEAHGQIQDIGVNEKNELIWGRRRLAAATSLGWEKISAKVREGLDEVDEQLFEWEEDFRQKPRNWKERCTATAKLYELIRNKRTLEAGEKFTYDSMAAWTGFSDFKIRYMLAVAEELKREPEGEIAKCKSITEALQIFAERRRTEAVQVQERRRQQQAAQSQAPASTPVKITEDMTSGLSEFEVHTEEGQTYDQGQQSADIISPNRIRIYGFNKELNADEVGTCAVGLLNRYDDPAEMIKVQDLVQRHIVSWVEPSLFASTMGLFEFVQPWPLVWITPNDRRGQGAFALDFKFGLVFSRDIQPSTGEQSGSFVIAPTNEDKMLPTAVVSYLLNALTIDGERVLCLGYVNPVDVAACGRVPVFFEPNKELYEKKRAELVNWYKDNIPGAVVE